MERTASAENTQTSAPKKQRGQTERSTPMKEMNRREFLTLSGAAVVALSLAGCGGGTYAPPAAPTGKEDIVLEAINKYRGALPPLTPDSGLDPAMEIVVKIATGEMEFDDKAVDALTATYANNYNGFFAPIGVHTDNDSTHATPLCVYSDNAELMAQNLDNQLDEGAKANLKSPAITLVNIKTFEYSGTTFWVALIAESKK